MASKNAAQLDQALAEAKAIGLGGARDTSEATQDADDRKRSAIAADVEAAWNLREQLRSIESKAVLAVEKMDAGRCLLLIVLSDGITCEGPTEAMAEVATEAASNRVALPAAQDGIIRQTLALPPKQRLQLQLRAAVERGDVDSVVSIQTSSGMLSFCLYHLTPDLQVACTIEIKRQAMADVEARANGATVFPLSAFPNVRSAEEFEAQLFASGSDKVFQFTYSRVPLAVSLTRLDPAMANAAVAISRSLRGVTGEAVFAQPELLAQQLIQVCLTQVSILPWLPVLIVVFALILILTQAGLRDEVLLQLMRHCTGNPSPVSFVRGARLLLLCLSTFPPSEPAENFVEAWIRRSYAPAVAAVTGAGAVSASYASGSGSQTEAAPSSMQLLQALHRTAFVGMAEAPPTLEHIQAVLTGTVART
jgi:hypothetical protein